MPHPAGSHLGVALANSHPRQPTLQQLLPQLAAPQGGPVHSTTIAAAKVFKDVAKENNSKLPKIIEYVNLYIAAASLSEQPAAEKQGDWQVLIKAGA